MTLKLDTEIYSDTQVVQWVTSSNIADPADGDTAGNSDGTKRCQC